MIDRYERHPRVRILRARYTQSDIPEHRGNLLIEALPPIKTFERWIDALERPVTFTESDRLAADHIRFHKLSRIKQFFEPLPRHIDMCEKIDELLRASYVARKPMGRDDRLRAQDAYDRQQRGEKPKTQNALPLSIYCTSVIGMSGLGKTTGMVCGLSNYDQALFHEDAGFHQLVWLKVDCPKDGNAVELLVKIVKEVDRVMGSKHRDELRKTPTYDDALACVKDLIDDYHIGVLVIDELQNLNVKRDANRERMLNLLQEIVNEKQIVLVVMGTYKAMGLVNIDMRHARRLTDYGSIDWPPLDKGFEWPYLLERLWRHQLVRNVEPLDVTLTEYLYEKTQGIIAVLVSAFILAQRRAIRTKEERLTKELFEQVFDKDLKPLKPILAALRSKDPTRIGRYEDMCSETVHAILDEEERRTRFVDAKRGSQNPMFTDEQQAIMTVMGNAIDNATATAAVRHAVEDGARTPQAMVNGALRLLFGTGEKLEGPRAPSGALSAEEGADYESLREAGLIKGVG